MNCFEFRKTLLTDPRANAPALSEHRDECPHCAAFVMRSERLEAELKAALLVDVPEGLTSRVLLRRSLADSSRATSRRRFLALAASVSAVAGLVGTRYWRQRRQLDEDVAQHLQMPHPVGLSAGANLLADREVAALIARAGFALRDSLGPVSNAWPCVLHGEAIAHLLVPGDHGAVTALVLPFALNSWRHSLVAPGGTGVIAPCSRGTLAILAQHESDLEQVEARLQRALRSV